ARTGRSGALPGTALRTGHALAGRERVVSGPWRAVAPAVATGAHALAGRERVVARARTALARCAGAWAGNRGPRRRTSGGGSAALAGGWRLGLAWRRAWSRSGHLSLGRPRGRARRALDTGGGRT